MNYTPTTTSELLADIRETYTIDPVDLWELVKERPTDVSATRLLLTDLLDAIHGDLDAYDKLPREWQELTH